MASVPSVPSVPSSPSSPSSPSDPPPGDRGRPIRASDVEIAVRAPRDEVELRAAFDLLGHVFLDDRADRVEQWRDSVVRQPQYRLENVRTVWSDGRCVAAAILHPRRVRMHGVVVPGAYITGVGVLGEMRGHGVGSALMQDIRAYGRERGMALVLLIGAHLFYDPFGYVDVFDDHHQFIAAADIASLPEPDGWTVRRATADDAPAVLALYEREYAGYCGQIARTVSEQRVNIELADEEFDRLGETRRGAGPRVAIGPDGRIGGYTTFTPGVHTWAGCEAVTAAWPAAVVLLREHAALPARTDEQGGAEDGDSIFWVSPSDSRTAQLLGDHLPVRTVVAGQPSAGWLATAIDVPRLLGLLRPGWSAVAAQHGHAVTLTVDDVPVELGAGGAAHAHVTVAVFLPLLFGFRTLDWALQQPGTRIDDAAVPVLTDIFSRSRPWITPTDGG